jgi:cytochrome c-type biogenesis protein CcmE
MSRSRIPGAIFTAVIAALLVTWLVTSGMDTQLVYYRTVEELLNERDQFQNRPVRVNGHLRKGSIERRKGTDSYRFVLEKNGRELQVRYSGILPDTLTTAAEVVVEGVLDAEGSLFQGSEILTKCPSKYEEEARRKETR